jgi:MFS transporter, DHA1 family, multidrug resistance protein
VQGKQRGLVVILGALIACAPMAVDMYLPALPALERAFATDMAHVQWTLATFFLGFSLGQALYGPISDRFGRRPPLYFGMSLFALASLGCILAPSIEWLMGLRFLQAIGACAGMVTARAIVRDLFDLRDSARVFSALMLVTGLAPILAPLVGGYLLIWFGWESIFLVLAAFGVANLIAAHFSLPETHRQGKPGSLALSHVLMVYGRLLTHRRFVGYSLSSGLTIAGMFAYIAASPAVFIQLFGVAEEQYGWLFGVNGLGFVLAAQVNGRAMRGAQPNRILRAALYVEAAAGLALLLAAATGAFGLIGIAVPLFVFIAALGFVMPNASALAMAPHGENAGAASAMLGVMQFGLAAIASTLVGAIHVPSAMPMAIAVAACGVLGLLANRTLVGRAD